MSYLSLGDQLSSQIVEVLSTRAKLKASEIDAQITCRFGVEISLPTLYRRLEELIEKQVITRHRTQFSLHPLWIDKYIRNAQKLKNILTTAPNSIVPLPLREGEMRKFYANSLIELDAIWNLIQLEVVAQSEGGKYAGYNSHSWHALTIEDSERDIFNSMIDRGKEVELALGNDSILDEYGAEAIKMPGFKSKITLKQPFSKEGYAIWASSEFVVECELPRALAAEFSAHFKTVKDPEQFNKEVFNALFEKKVTCVLKVWKSKKKAAEVLEALKNAA